MGCAYILTSPSGHSYIGITLRTLEQRWHEHVVMSRKRDRKNAIHVAIAKYGADTFVIEELFGAETWEELCRIERALIECCGTFGNGGYNMTPGGDGVASMDEETRKRHRERTADGTRRAWAEGKMDARAKTISDPEYKRRHALAQSAASLAAFADPNGSAMQNLLKARRSQEARERVRKQVKALWTDPDYRAAQVAKRLAREPRTSESRRAQGEVMRKLIADRKAAGTYWLNDRTTKS